MAVAIVAASCPSCSRIEIHEGDGKIRIERHFGAIGIDIRPAMRDQLVSIRSVGLVRTATETALGYHRAELVLLGDSCRLVLWVDDARQVARARELLGRHENVCVVATRAHSEKAS